VNICFEGGWLVGARIPVSDFAPDYLWAKNGIHQGCNHLICLRCKMAVSQKPVGEQRHYRCNCSEEVETNIRSLADIEAWGLAEPPPWHCGGHPQLALPAEVDGVMITRSNLNEIAKAALSGAIPLVLPMVAQSYPVAWLHRLYRLLMEPALALNIISQLGSPELLPSIADFYRREPFAPGAERLIQQAFTLLGVPNPQYPGKTLDQWLQVVLAARLETDPQALEIAKNLVVRAVPTASLLEALVTEDQEWVGKNLLAIFMAAPSLELARDLLVESGDILGEAIVEPAVAIGKFLKDPAYLQLVSGVVPKPFSNTILQRL
jgi:hypothetical protein